MRPRPASPRARGMTMVELVLATGLLTLLMVAVFALLRDFVGLWESSEGRRRQVEEASTVADLLAADLHALAPGARGDLLAEWVFFDTDGDGVNETKWPRLRLVRHASPAEIARLQGALAPEQRELGEGLVEVIYAALPAEKAAREPDKRAQGYLWRGVRLYNAREGVSFFDPAYLAASGRPTPGTVNEVRGGLLWLGMQFAMPTTVLHDGWRLGAELEDALPGWDAWKRGRANRERHVWNEVGAALPEPRGRPLLPRRVRFELEFERPDELKRRTRLVAPIGPLASELPVDDGERLPPPGGHVLVDAEWMEVLAVRGDSASVRRGVRGTPPQGHEAGRVVHWGTPTVREVPVALGQEDWRL